MSRFTIKQYALTILSVVAISVGLKSASAEDSAGEKPNILIDLYRRDGFVDPNCFDNPLVKTHHIDKLAAEGIKLTNYYYVNSTIRSAS